MDTYHVMTLTRHKSMQSFKRYTKRADQRAAEKAFYHAVGEGQRDSENADLIRGATGATAHSELPQNPVSFNSTQTAKPPLKTTRVHLWLRVENNNKFIRRKKKVREQVERYCLSHYAMQKLRPDGWEYELTIPYESGQDLEKTIDDLIAEMSNLADLEYCFIEADVSEIGTEQRW
jgi:hypothetical protein